MKYSLLPDGPRTLQEFNPILKVSNVKRYKWRSLREEGFSQVKLANLRYSIKPSLAKKMLGFLELQYAKQNTKILQFTVCNITLNFLTNLKRDYIVQASVI